MLQGDESSGFDEIVCAEGWLGLLDFGLRLESKERIN